MWQPDNLNATAANTNSGSAIRHLYLNPIVDMWTFSTTIPLSSIFNFFNDYRKVMFGIQHKISLTRTTNTRALFRNAAGGGAPAFGAYVALTQAAADAAMNITKLRWAMPYIVPSIEEQSKIIQIINDRIPAPLTFLNKSSDYIAVPAATTLLGN
jgi:hypothetical protein